MATAEACPRTEPKITPAVRGCASATAFRQASLDLVGLDLRSLAVLRIGLGLLLLCDLAVRAGDLQAHYTDLGVLPRDALPPSAVNSLHLLHGSAWFEAILFGVAALFAVALLFGFHTRLATFVSCFLLVSLHARNGLILDGGDDLLRVLLFWSIFLPLGARFSVDQLRGRGPRPSPRVVSAATVALILQVCFVYWFTALLKSDASWRTEGTAIAYALNIDQFTTRLGRSLLAYPNLLRLLTFATFWLEAAGPALLFVPWGRGPLRTLVVAAFVLFHLAGLNLTMELGHFPYICAVAWLALLPGWFWDQLPRRLGHLSPSPPTHLPQGERGERAPSPPTPLPQGERGERHDQPIRTPLWINGLAGFFLVYVFLWNVRALDFPRFQTIFPEQLNWIGKGFGLDQWWGMFSPCPPKDDGWYVIVGKLENGTEVDLFHDGAPVYWGKPELVSATYPNTRWRKYHLNLWLKEHVAHRPGYARYLAQEWDSRHQGGERLATIDIYFMLEMTHLDHPSKAQRVLLCHYPCSTSEPGERGASAP